MACANSADQTVNEQINSLANAADAAISTADSAIERLGNGRISRVHPIYPDTRQKDFKIDYHTGLAPVSSYTLNIPTFTAKVPALNSIPEIDLGDAPEFTESLPSFDRPNIPKNSKLFNVYEPLLNFNLDLPDPIDLAPVKVPTLTPIVIPKVPELDIPDFNPACEPDCGADLIAPPDGEFNFTEVDYTSDVLEQVDSLVQQMMAGGVGIPDSIWDTIWQKRREALDSVSSVLVKQINAEWASRGFFMPQGIQNDQVQKAREKAYTENAEFNREIAIKYADAEVKNLQFAVQQGIAFESLRGGWHEQEMQRAFEASRTVLQISLDIFNASINFYNAQITQFSTEAQVYKTVVEAEVSKLAAAKMEIEAQALINDINKTSVEIYKVQYDALAVQVQNFKVETDAAVAELSAVKLEIDYYNSRISKYSEEVKQSGVAYSNYKAQAEVEGLKFSAYSAAAQSFSYTVDAFKANGEAQSIKNKAIIDNNNTLNDEFKANILSFTSEAETEIKRINGEIAIFNSQIEKFKAERADYARAKETESTVQKNQIAQYAADTRIQMSGAQVGTEAFKTEFDINSKTSLSIADIYAGLAGSAMSAINVGAGIHDNIGCNGS